MYHDKQLLATRLYELLDDAILTDDKGTISIDNLLNPQQKYELIMHIMAGLPKSDLERVIEFNNIFKVDKEATHIIENFKHKELRFELILEETLELGKALGISDNDIYHSFLKLFVKVKAKEIPESLTETLDALTDLLFVVYSAIDVFNLTDIQYDAFQEVFYSNMSKLILTNNTSDNPLEVVRQSVKALNTKGYDVVTIDLKNNHLAILDNKTGKILKPVTFIEPNLDSLINKHFKNSNK